MFDHRLYSMQSCNLYKSKIEDLFPVDKPLHVVTDLIGWKVMNVHIRW